MQMPVGFNMDYDRDALVAGIEQASLNIARIQSVLNVQTQALQGHQQTLVLLLRTGGQDKRCAQLRAAIEEANEAVKSFYAAIRVESQKQVQFQQYVEYIDWMATHGDVHVRPN